MRIPATIASIGQETPTVKSFRLDLGTHEFSFLPGQWVDCYVEIDGTPQVAGYSMTSSSLTKGTIDLAVKLVGQNPVTHFLHRRARVGDRLCVEEGQGDFYYRRNMGDSLVLMGGGIGLTPLMSMIRYVDQAEPKVSATLLYSARTPSELLFRQQLEEIAARNVRIRCRFTVTRPSTEPWSGRTGRIDAAMLAEAEIDLGALFYLSGPPAMVEDMAHLLEERGVPASRIKHETW